MSNSYGTIETVVKKFDISIPYGPLESDRVTLGTTIIARVQYESISDLETMKTKLHEAVVESTRKDVERLQLKWPLLSVEQAVS